MEKTFMFTIKINYLDLKKIAMSGQCFRMHMIDDTHAELVALGRYLQIADLGDSKYVFSCSEKEFNDIWYNYFDLSRDYDSIIKNIDEDDEYLRLASEYSYGIRILRQEPFETLISYIISQRRSIPSIMTSVERLATRYGKEIRLDDIELDDKIFAKPIKEKYYSFPSSYELEEVSVSDIRELGVGYRAEYIFDAIKRINCNKVNLLQFYDLSDEELLNSLLDMHGVGVKVANCVMLYAYSRTHSFPIDVWMKRILDKYYNGIFDLDHYKDSNGILQQLMFYYERTKSV